MHATPNEQPSIDRAASTLTPAQEKEMRRMDPNGDGIIDKKEARYREVDGRAARL